MSFIIRYSGAHQARVEQFNILVLQDIRENLVSASEEAQELLNSLNDEDEVD